jgi:DNA-directed RNA polymerase specialized sigma24 family protein
MELMALTLDRPVQPEQAADASETILMNRIRAGDREAFGELARSHEQRAFSTALTILGSRLLAEQAVQSVLVEVYEEIKRKDIGRFRDWFNGRLVCCVVEMAEKKLPWQEGMAGVMVRMSDEDGGPHELIRSLLRLPLPQRIVIAFTYCQQYMIPQIASLLKIDEREVKARLYEARMKLL